MPILFHLAATAARMPSDRHNVEGDVLLQHTVTLTGWSLFCAAPNRAVETRGEKTLAALAAIIFVFLCSVKLLNGCVCV
jgi:hypothetical protein